ncbi:hypothetical protein DPMN_164525 [Dreissena polymorpha]|uniref:Uncharacterized protein n=1 Tax=Dreissena polymorpha TaxID=45954 RepID=A0A9D4EW24_DREPO|nr:hypothetical protein DPMN_164525 [Dreissena polymorpha]
MVDLDLVTNSTAATSSCFGNISLLLQSSVRSVVNRWQSGTHCVENYIFSLDHVTGSISVTDFGVSRTVLET